MENKFHSLFFFFLRYKYKQDGDEDSYTKSYYEEVLDKLDPQKVYEDLKDCVLLCWETTKFLN